MNIDLAFGKAGLTVYLPDNFHYEVLKACAAEPIAEPAGVIERALASPIGSRPLSELARGKTSAAISVCDITRPAPNAQTLPPLLRTLEQAGIKRESILILVATGLHRPATDDEIRQICGPDIAANYRVVNHDARTLDQHAFLGNTNSGTPVYIDDRFLSADLHITLGFIEPHLMLGFSGGRKLVAPGLAAQQTISVLHSPKFMRDSRASEGSIEDNPLHHELLEIAHMAHHDFILDVALSRDRSIAGVFAGDPVEAHRRGVQFVSRAMLHEMDEPVDAVITTAAGHPLDLTFYQAIKGITAASHIVKPGGRILLAAACNEGAGAPEFCHMLQSFPSGSGFMDHILDRPVVPDQWQLEKLALVTTRQNVLFFVPGLPDHYHASLWGQVFGSLNAAIHALTNGLAVNARIAVIPEGPYVLAKLRSAELTASSV